MANLLVSAVITRAARLLYDQTNVRWTVDELVEYAGDAEQQIVLVRPDLNAVNAAIQLAAGTKQSIPDDGVRFLRAIRNRGSTGNQLGNAIRSTYMEALDSEIRDWHSRTTTNDVQHYMADNRDPKTFYIYPGLANAATLYIEILYGQAPPLVSSPGDAFTLDAVHVNPLVDWVCYRAFSKDAEYGGNPQRAQAHYAAFYNALQVQMRNQWTMAAGRDRPAGMPPEETQLPPRG